MGKEVLEVSKRDKRLTPLGQRISILVFKKTVLRGSGGPLWGLSRLGRLIDLCAGVSLAAMPEVSGAGLACNHIVFRAPLMLVWVQSLGRGKYPSDRSIAPVAPYHHSLLVAEYEPLSGAPP